MYKRSIDLPKTKTTFFLWGPRQVGKSSLIHSQFPDDLLLDLLKTDVFMKYQRAPYLLREELEFTLKRRKAPLRVIIDEVQKVPLLLDEVHWLIENRPCSFVLCGASARKLKRGHGNLLGGRALRYELHPLCSAELGDDFDLSKAINRGLLPRYYVDENWSDNNWRAGLKSYVEEYLKEEILQEGLVRNLPAFSTFLEAASFSDTEPVEYKNIAQDVGVSAPTIKSYFEILQDTLLGRFLPAYRKRPKRRIQTTPKFYFFDVGVVNILAKRHTLEAGSELFGKAFENFIFHEINCFRAYRARDMDLSFWKLAGGTEVDFILNDMEVAIEVKGSPRISDHHLKGLRELKEDHPKVKRRIIVSLDPSPRITADKIEILPYRDFLALLWENQLVDTMK